MGGKETNGQDLWTIFSDETERRERTVVSKEMFEQIKKAHNLS